MATKRRRVNRKKSGGSGISLKAIFLLFLVLAGAAWFLNEPSEIVGVGPVASTGEVASLSPMKKETGESTVKKWINAVVPEEKRDRKETVSVKEKEPSLVKEKPKGASAPVHATKSASTPQGEVTGRLAVVIDDAGYDLASQRIYEGLGVPFTLAIMPNKSDTRAAAQEWAAKGMELILHQPMESVSGVGMEDKTILTSMSDEEIRNMLRESLDQLPEAVGINNHQGSKATIDYRVMTVVSEELAKRHLFFLDSHTNTTTVADKTSLAYGVPYAKNGLFVDNSTDESEIRAMIAEGARRAKTHGTYIIIGHCRPHTAAAFRDMVPKLLSEGIQFIYVSSLVK